MKRLFYLAIFSFLAFSFACNSQPEEMMVTNHKQVPDVINNFVDGAIYYGVDYRKEIKELKSIRLIKGDNTFIGRYNQDRTEVNEDLEKYPYLMKIIIFRQIGKMYGLKTDKSGKLTIMSDRWEITPEYESFAYKTLNRQFVRRHFFQELKKISPIEKQI